MHWFAKTAAAGVVQWAVVLALGGIAVAVASLVGGLTTPYRIVLLVSVGVLAAGLSWMALQYLTTGSAHGSTNQAQPSPAPSVERPEVDALAHERAHHKAVRVAVQSVVDELAAARSVLADHLARGEFWYASQYKPSRGVWSELKGRLAEEPELHAARTAARDAYDKLARVQAAAQRRNQETSFGPGKIGAQGVRDADGVRDALGAIDLAEREFVAALKFFSAEKGDAKT